MNGRSLAGEPRGFRGGTPRRAVWPVVWAAVALISVVLLAPGGAVAGSGSHLTLSALENSTISAINELRAAHGLAPLTVSPLLFNSASVHDRQMLEGGYFGHQSADGEGYAQRLELFYPPRHFGYYAVGENLLWAEDTIDPSEMITLWMESKEHRANLLKPAWRQVGVAAVTVPAAGGMYAGLGTVTVVTVDFGVRS